MVEWDCFSTFKQVGRRDDGVHVWAKLSVEEYLQIGSMVGISREFYAHLLSLGTYIAEVDSG